jgi:hypothetical protein
VLAGAIDTQQMMKFRITVFAIIFFAIFPAGLAAQNSNGASAPVSSATAVEAPNERLARLEQQVADAKGSADNAWMLTSSALVLMMTGPGLALFYGGLVRKKNVLGTMMQSFAMMAIVTVAWALYGYSLSFCAAWALRLNPRTPPRFPRKRS